MKEYPVAASRANNAWIGAVAPIVVGLAFLVKNAPLLTVHFTWWGLFLLIPVVIIGAQVWSEYRGGGRLTRRAGGLLIAALAVATVGIISTLGLDWAASWPLWVIFVGIVVLISVTGA